MVGVLTTVPSFTVLRMVLFSGGRGAGALGHLVATDPRVALTVGINGYDDGASTGEVRRFLGDALGPSDFRKNASRFARLRASCPESLIEFLDRRLPDSATAADLAGLADGLERGDATSVGALAEADPELRAAVALRLRAFDAERIRTGRTLKCGDAAVGNCVFAGAFLLAGRRFNAAVDDYCALMGLPPGLIENVTTGENAFLVAIDDDGHVLGSEEAIVDARRQNRVREIFLIPEPLTPAVLERLAQLPVDTRRAELDAMSIEPAINPRFAAAVAAADLIIYAPGTQHSSLFPSYLTPGLGALIAANLTAIKLLVTNIQTDAEIAGRTAVDLIDQAVFYLRSKGRLPIPPPCLVTHVLVNDPSEATASKPYVPLGRLESLEDPRLLRVANYEDGVSGRHDASKVLAPYIEGIIARDRSVERVAVVLTDTRSANKITQTLLEMVRGGIRESRIDLRVLHTSDEPLEASFVEHLGFPVVRIAAADAAALDAGMRAALREARVDYVVLFDSSGMYNGGDVTGLVSHLALGRLDAIWGSRRLSVRDIQESYRVRYRDKAVAGLISALGSHILSFQFLALYGRYVADTLSGARVVRVADVLALPCPLDHKLANQYLLSTLLKRHAEILEIPVQFLAISPEQVRRTTVGDGVTAVLIAVRERLTRRQVLPPS
jgi:2-phospho-L-lactate transferase/gluconeogenesis factor (CofD/UPF0052 family)